MKQCKTTDRTPPPSVLAVRDCQQANQGQTAVRGCQQASQGQTAVRDCQQASQGQTAARDCQQASQGQTAARDCQQASQRQTAVRDCQQANQVQTAARDCQQASQWQTAVRECQQASQEQTAVRDCQQANQVHITASPAVDCHTRWFPGGHPLRHGLCHYSQNWVCWQGRWVPHQYPPVHDWHHCQSQNWEWWWGRWAPQEYWSVHDGHYCWWVGWVPQGRQTVPGSQCQNCKKSLHKRQLQPEGPRLAVQQSGCMSCWASGCMAQLVWILHLPAHLEHPENMMWHSLVILQCQKSDVQQSLVLTTIKAQTHCMCQHWDCPLCHLLELNPVVPLPVCTGSQVEYEQQAGEVGLVLGPVAGNCETIPRLWMLVGVVQAAQSCCEFQPLSHCHQPPPLFHWLSAL